MTNDASLKTIGMLGGMSWESTAEYYRLANELVAERLGGLHSAQLLLASVDFARIEAQQQAGAWDDAGRDLGVLARNLQTAGADALILCTNTMHKVAQFIVDAIDIPFLDIRDVTATAVLGAGVQRVGLLATKYTMEQEFYIDHLRNKGIDVVVPDSEQRADVNRIIFDELCRGLFHGESRQRYVEIIGGLAANGCEGVILGCTEIELLISQADSSLQIFPTTRLHVEAALSA
jgi:aspartate racemase